MSSLPYILSALAVKLLSLFPLTCFLNRLPALGVCAPRSFFLFVRNVFYLFDNVKINFSVSVEQYVVPCLLVRYPSCKPGHIKHNLKIIESFF